MWLVFRVFQLVCLVDHGVAHGELADEGLGVADDHLLCSISQFLDLVVLMDLTM